MTKEYDELLVGSIVRVSCSNAYLDGKMGTLLMKEEDEGIIFGTCVLIDGAVYGFLREEVSALEPHQF